MITDLVFDLDGTLVDSLPGIEHAARAAVAAVLPDRTLPPIAPFVGPPIRQILSRALGPLPEETLDALAAAFRRVYDAEGWRHTACYPGVEALLEAVMAAGLRCHLLTNKPQAPTLAILSQLKLSGAFETVVTPDAVSPPHPSKTAGLRALLANRGLAPERAMLVGDAEDDRAAAAACGLRFAAAAYGYGTAAQASEARLERPLDLLPLLALSPTLR